MKKRFFLIGALVAMSMSAMFVSCKDKNEVSDGCNCTITESDASGNEHFSKSDMEAMGASTCGELAAVLRTQRLLVQGVRRRGQAILGIVC